MTTPNELSKVSMSILFCACILSCHPSVDYFDQAHEGFMRNEDSCFKYMPGKIMGDSLSTVRYNRAHDSESYFLGAETYVLKMKQ